MPLKTCTSNGKSGYKWGDSGKCYTGTGAREKALKQGRAIESSKTQSRMDQLLEHIDSIISKKK